MKAEEARRLSGSVDIGPHMKVIYDRIAGAARRGEDSIVDPTLHGIAVDLTAAQAEAIYSRLRQDGYRVTYHRCGPSVDPRERDYVTVEW
jgi:hypothetical protein